MKQHNSLNDSQIHNAKGFEPARKRSISTKNRLGVVDWIKGNYTSTTSITVFADVDGNLHHEYFCLYSSYDANKYAVYFNISGGAAMATPTGFDGVIAADVTASGVGSTAAQVGTALSTILDAHADFTSASLGSGRLTITGLTTASPAYKVGASVSSISITDIEITDEVLTTDDSGDMKWISKSTNNYSLKGYTASGETDYAFGEDMTDNKAPYQMDVTYGDDTLAGGFIGGNHLFKLAGGIVIPKACTVSNIKGWAASDGGHVFSIMVCKVTPVVGSTANLVATEIEEYDLTGLANNNKGIVFGAALSVALAEGDIVFPLLKEVTGGSNIFFKLTMETITQ